jgi:hypothetical protein
VKFLSSIAAPFKTPTAADEARRQLAEAERQALKYRAQAELYRASAVGDDALAEMYERRAARLRAAMPETRHDAGVVFHLPELHAA